MDTLLIEYLKDFLSKNDLDGLIINSTNEFLVEYNLLELNSRYYVTNFTGSMGDVLFTNNKIYLFVDSRYHQQAENQTKNEYVEVVKIPLTQTYLEALTEKITPYFRLGVVSKKTSKKFYDELMKNLSQKSSSIKLINIDPVMEYKKDSIPKINYEVFPVNITIAGVSSDEKYNQIKEYAGKKFNILVTSLEDIAYITNLRSYSFKYSAIFPAKAIINEECVKIYSDCELPDIGEKYKVFPLSEFENSLKEINNSEIYIDENGLTIADYLLINKSNKILQGHLNLFKTVKNDNEIAHLNTCFERSDDALKVIYKMLHSDTIYSEYDYYDALVKALKKNGALSLSFKPIVAGGANSSIIHYSTPSKEKMINEGDLLLIDYGAYYEGGYATDTTRTFIKGTPNQEQKVAYTAVLKAFLNAYYEKYDKKDTYYKIDNIARETINKSISEDFKFAHSTGHGVGISVHENPPKVSSGNTSKTKIIENTVFSIEPGVYKEGWGGIRLENTVCAVKDEDKTVMHSFSRFPFEIDLVDISMLNDYEKYYYMKWQANACII